jgi:hypothetical protein
VGAANQYVIGLVPQWNKLFTSYTAGGNVRAAVYDLGTDNPTLVEDRALYPAGLDGQPNPMTTLIEPGRKRFYTLAGGHVPAGEVTIKVAGVEDNHMAPEVWNVHATVPGFAPAGMTYSPEDDRLYLVGELSGVSAVTASTWTFGFKYFGSVAAVAALDPDDGSLLWARPVPDCRYPLYSLGMGSFIARSSPALSDPTLFFACSTGGGFGGGTNPGQPGVVAMRIKAAATQLDTPDFDVRYHPISGLYFNGATSGVAGFDPGSDRFFMQSISPRTPGAWVYDGRADSWVGAITAPSPHSNYMGIDNSTGHYYMGGSGGSAGYQDGDFLLVADGRAKRPQNGIVGAPEFSPGSFITVDPKTHRLIYADSDTRELRVVQDLTPVSPPQQPTDYDAQTDDVPETPETFIAFSGGGGGYGARVTAIGDIANVGVVPLVADGQQPTSRAAVFARSPNALLQPSASAAAAAAASIDTATEQGLRDNGAKDAWAWGTTTCLDGGEGVESPPETTSTGTAAVRCRLSQYETTAQAHHAAGQALDLAVADTSYQSRIKRTPDQGMATEATASAAGVRVTVPGAGSLEIAGVDVTATSGAHGQTGSAQATWSRTVRGVVVKDESGKVLYASPGCTTSLKHNGGKALEGEGSQEACDQIAEAVRKALQVHVRVFFPTPQVEATPRGAYAGVGQTDVDHAREVTVNDQGILVAGETATQRAAPAVEVVVYHDSTERSRTLVHLAGVETTSIFTVNTSADDPDCATGGCIAGGSASASGSVSDLGSQPVMGPSAVGDGSAIGALPLTRSGRVTGGGRPAVAAPSITGYLLARRSVGDAALAVAFLGLAAAAVSAVVRRRRLTALGRLGQ